MKPLITNIDDAFDINKNIGQTSLEQWKKFDELKQKRKNKVYELHKQGWSGVSISKEVNLSVGYVYQIIKSKKHWEKINNLNKEAAIIKKDKKEPKVKMKKTEYGYYLPKDHPRFKNINKEVTK